MAGFDPKALAGKQHVLINDFAGGLNLRESPSELGDNESGDCMNVTLDETGGVVKRLGRSRLNNSGALPGVMSNLGYWQSKQYTIFQVGASLYKTTDEFVSWSSFATFTTTARAAWCDFNGKLVVVHPVDGVFTYDGTTWTLATAVVKGSCIANWQNKVWVADVATPRVWWSNAGNPALWTTASDFNDLREKDDALITAMGVGQGMDVAGRPGLLVFKAESTYRINSSSTGAYTTIDGATGAAGPLAVATLLGVTAVINKAGIFTVDPGGASELKLASAKLAPLFDPMQIAYDHQDLFCAGVYRDRFIFSLPKAGSTSNDRTLEFHPTDGWIVPHDFGAAAFTVYAKNASKLYAASPNTAYVYEQFKGGADDGVAITARYQTRWLIPSQGALNSFTRLRMFARGSFSVFTLFDYSLGQGELNAVSLLGNTFAWNAPGIVWNGASMIWGPTLYEDTQDFGNPGFGRAVSFRFTHSGSDSFFAPKLLTDGAAPEVGAFAVYALAVDYVQSGNA